MTHTDSTFLNSIPSWRSPPRHNLMHSWQCSKGLKKRVQNSHARTKIKIPNCSMILSTWWRRSAGPATPSAARNCSRLIFDLNSHALLILDLILVHMGLAIKFLFLSKLPYLHWLKWHWPFYVTLWKGPITQCEKCSGAKVTVFSYLFWGEMPSFEHITSTLRRDGGMDLWSFLIVVFHDNYDGIS